MRSNKKEVVNKIVEHIKEYHEEGGLKLFKQNVEAVKYGNMNDYEAIKNLIDGGTFLIYHEDVKNFLNGLGINPDNKEYTDNQSWELYKNLIAREGVKLV